MKLALITPKGVYFSNDPAIAEFFKSNLEANDHNSFAPRYAYWTGGSLGLLIVAALTPQEIEVEFIDENYEAIDFDKPYDVVALSAMTQQAVRAYEIADRFRAKGSTVVIGGMHATVLPEEAKEHADAVVIGEAEHTWPVLINDLSEGALKPFYKSDTLADMTKSPLPRYELLKKYNYSMIWVQTTRGCPRSCDFCAASNIYGKAYRHKTITQVLNEINYIRGLWNEPLINFADDNMFVDKKYAADLVARLSRMDLRWTAQTDVSVADDGSFLDLLQKSNCKILFIGFETLSKSGIIDAHGWKRNRIDAYPEIIRKIQSRGIGVLGAFIIGLDSDDTSVVDDVSRFIVDNRMYAAQISVLTPLPGTRLRERLEREGRIIPSKWNNYTFTDVNYLPARLTPAELQNGLLDVYKRVYSKEARRAVVLHFKDIYLKLHVQRVAE
ncbi:MAG TPA: radical SAM protein [Nitrospirota bacterium]|nr:radical SAM protein [Nitrospirota bacterium]